MSNFNKALLPEVILVDIPGKGRQYVRVLNTSSTTNSQISFLQKSPVNVITTVNNPSPQKIERSDDLLQVSSFKLPCAQISSEANLAPANEVQERMVEKGSSSTIDITDDIQNDEIEHNFTSPEKRYGKGEKAGVSPNEKSCNCKRSGCSNKYCECVKANVACSHHCNCSACTNGVQPIQKKLFGKRSTASTVGNSPAKKSKEGVIDFTKEDLLDLGRMLTKFINWTNANDSK